MPRLFIRLFLISAIMGALSVLISTFFFDFPQCGVYLNNLSIDSCKFVLVKIV